MINILVKATLERAGRGWVPSILGRTEHHIEAVVMNFPSDDKYLEMPMKMGKNILT